MADDVNQAIAKSAPLGAGIAPSRQEREGG